MPGQLSFDRLKVKREGELFLDANCEAGQRKDGPPVLKAAQPLSHLEFKESAPREPTPQEMILRRGLSRGNYGNFKSNTGHTSLLNY